MAESQNADAVLMVRPVRFEANQETAVTNEFQRLAGNPESAELQRLALAEFDGLVQLLRDAGVTVCVFEDTPEPHTPDSIFPNNWLSLHGDGTVVTYPMLTANRRAERKSEIIEQLRDVHGFTLGQPIDFAPFEEAGKILEGTGSLVLDRAHRVAYACLSPRTDPGLVKEFGQRLGYRCSTFEAVGPGGQAVYHTNVLLAVGSTTAVLCAEAIVDGAQRHSVMASLENSGHELLAITAEQMLHFAGNMLEVRSASGDRFWVMSRQAETSLTAEQRARLCRDATILAAPMETIERCSGGSVRCMLAEIHLPRVAR
ncbi:MAG: hypothetical protein ACI9EF_001280 [Pseudohongiellaceae bacterium]